MTMNIFSDTEKAKILQLKDFARQCAKPLIKNLYVFGKGKKFDASNIVIAGGCFVSKFNDETPRDVDIFLLNDTSLKSVFNTVFENMKQVSSDIDNPIADKAYIRGNNKIERVVEQRFEDRPKFQYIYTEYDTRKELIDDFDFAHTTISYNIGEDTLYATRQAIDCIMNKRLILNGDNKAEQWRVEKFINKSWSWKFVIDENVLV
jgi:hypothetical protein